MSRSIRRLSWTTAYFAVAVLALLSEESLAALLPPLHESQDLYIHRALLTAVWIVGGMLFNRLARTLYWEGIGTKLFHGGAAPKLLVDVAAGIVYIFVLLGILVVVFEYPVTGVWATSSVVGLVLGFALRNVILDLFIGLAVNFDRPYRIGDWVMIHGRRVFPEENVIGCIQEINWRTTRLRTTDNNIVIVPNSVMGEKIVTNFMDPGTRSRFRLTFTLDFSVPPPRALRVLEAAVRSADGILETPKAPRVRLNQITEMGVEYEIRYWIEPEATSPSKARHRINQAVLEQLSQAGMTLAYPKHDVYYEPMPTRQLDASSVDDRVELLGKVALFEGLRSEETAELATRISRRVYSAGESVIRRGDRGDSMFVLLEGLLGVQIPVSYDQGDTVREEEVTRIAPGSFFGEMSLLTGEQRSATVISITDVVVYEIRREDLEPLLRERPAIAEAMSRALAIHQLRDAQAKSDMDRREREAQIRSTADLIINKMKVLFNTWSRE